MSELVVEREHRVSPIELFFDLVFVFGLTQVTTLLLDERTWGGLGRGLLVLAVLWWVWASYAWLTNAANVEAGIVTATILFATGASFIAALAVPEAYGAHRLLFGIALFAVLLAFVALFALVSKRTPDLLAAVLRIGWVVLLGAVLILVAAFVPSGVRPAVWAVALFVGFFGAGATGTGGFRVEPAHFAERHGLIVIIAIGESLGAIGFGARETHLGGGVIAAVALALVVAASFWLAYFDFASGGIQRLLTEKIGEERVRLARDVYTYAHFGMVAGIVLFAFAMRAALTHVHADLKVVPAVALCCGSALYLASFVAVRWRASRTIGRGRPLAAVACAALIPAAVVVPALAAVGLVAAVWVALHAYELIGFREARAERRAVASA
ncbi:MAG: low temperature requirement protein A [Actinobacteria bacterium]|nr:low temperature requirement protein A [Actinomycetota bacterium]